MTQITLAFGILLLYWVACPFGYGAPIDRIQKRSPVYCFPVVPPTTPFSWLDCMNAVLTINAKNPNLNGVPYVFGSDVGATHTDDVYSWTSGSSRFYLCSVEHVGITRKLIKQVGTCVIEMAIESSVNQAATWSSIQTAAMRIIETCVRSLNQFGGTYVRK